MHSEQHVSELKGQRYQVLLEKEEQPDPLHSVRCASTRITGVKAFALSSVVYLRREGIIPCAPKVECIGFRRIGHWDSHLPGRIIPLTLVKPKTK